MNHGNLVLGTRDFGVTQGLFATTPWKMRNCEVLEWLVMPKKKPVASEESSTVTVDLPQPRLRDG